MSPDKRVTSSSSRVTSLHLRVMSSNARVTSSYLPVTSSNPQIKRLKRTSWEIKSTI